jgi:ribosomal protein S18 acetylase RimI-like enzyme
MTTIRAGQISDAPHLADVFIAAWRGGYRGIVADSVIESLDRTAWAASFGEQLEKSPDSYRVAVDGTCVVGFAIFGPDPDQPEDADRGYLASLYVHPEASGKGVGRDLLRSALAELRNTGRHDVTLWVFRENARARRLYERAGFLLQGDEYTDPQWGAPQIRYRRRPRSEAQALAAAVADGDTGEPA